MSATTQRRMAAATAILLLLTALQMVLSVGVTSAVASTVEPEYVSGNPTCSDFGERDGMLKIEEGGELTDVDNGTYTAGDLEVTIAVYETEAGWEFDWTANTGIGVVVAKGGPGANVYTYTSATSDTGLHAPWNSGSDSWYGLSHISFCSTTTDDTTPTSGDTTPTTGDTTPTTGDTTPTTGDTTPTTGDTAPTTRSTTPTTASELGAIGDLVWFDLDRDGRQDAAETPVSGATVQLLSPDGTVLATQVTGGDGLYLFDELPAATYRVRVTFEGAVYTTPRAPGVPFDVNSDVDSLGQGVGLTALISLDEGEIDLTWDAGLVVEVLGVQIESTTTVEPTTTVAPVAVDTLPFTGLGAEEMLVLALVVSAAGGVLLYSTSRADEEYPTTETIGRWSSD